MENGIEMLISEQYMGNIYENEHAIIFLHDFQVILKRML